MRRTRSAYVLITTSIFALVTGAGCTQTPAQEAAASRSSPVASAEVAVAPKQLVEEVKRAVAAAPLSLGIEEQNKGTLVTGWKRYRGDWHIGRHWQERTRYRIDVAPDWDEPAARSKITVTAETEQRAAEGQSWGREARVFRPERARGALDAIVRRLPAATTTR